MKQYVELQDGVYKIKGTRVSLDSIVYTYLAGETAESIAQAFQVLRLEQVYGAITYYLANRSDVDSYLKNAREDFEEMRKAARKADPMFYQKLSHTQQIQDAMP